MQELNYWVKNGKPNRTVRPTNTVFINVFEGLYCTSLKEMSRKGNLKYLQC